MVDRNKVMAFERLRSELDAARRSIKGDLSLHGSGGNDGLEARIARLEASASHVERDVGELRTDMRDVRDRLARLEEMLSHLPGKGYLWLVGLTIVGLIFAALAVLPKVQASIGIAPY